MRDEDFSGLNVADIMSRWPATIGVFIDFRMHCIGCPIGHFHTLADAAEEHRIPLDRLAVEIAAAIASDGDGSERHRAIMRDPEAPAAAPDETVSTPLPPAR
ncbi:DUF1858 domain-containing protein [Devosia sp.]|uniref:DUF1858 domain-containing protein n=1 Tax=Devosia sp. TaxID=1871048 RepID=UPI002F0CEE17